MLPEINSPANHREFIEARQDAILRVQKNAIKADLNQIQADLRLDLILAKVARGEQVDTNTLLVVDWHQRFTKCLAERTDPHVVFNEFKTLLQEILVDSLFQTALDENCLLGSDGETYTKMTLQVYRSLVEASLQERSPLHPEIEAPLETQPHLVLNYMVGWLKRHNVVHRNVCNEKVEEAYRHLVAMAKEEPEIIDQEEAIRILIAHRIQREEKDAQEQAAKIAQRAEELDRELREKVRPLIDLRFGEARQLVDNQAHTFEIRVEDLKAHMNHEINLVKPLIVQLEKEHEELVIREQKLEQQIQAVQKGINDLHATHLHLQKEKVQLEKAINDRNKGRAMGLVKAIVSIAACALASYGACQVLKPLLGALKIGAAPVSGGGVKFFATIPI